MAHRQSRYPTRSQARGPSNFRASAIRVEPGPVGACHEPLPAPTRREPARPSIRLWAGLRHRLVATDPARRRRLDHEAHSVPLCDGERARRSLDKDSDGATPSRAAVRVQGFRRAPRRTRGARGSVVDSRQLCGIQSCSAARMLAAQILAARSSLSSRPMPGVGRGIHRHRFKTEPLARRFARETGFRRVPDRRTGSLAGHSLTRGRRRRAWRRQGLHTMATPFV